MSSTLSEGLTALESALEISQGRIDRAVWEESDRVLAKCRERQNVGMDHTVVVFAGSTGSGKSSLVNAIVGQDVARVAATRPTTNQTQAITASDSADLLDWLGITHRTVVDSLPVDSGLILVDLPDIDSTSEHNHTVARRIIDRADVVLWVMDPQKYADAVVHEDYLARLTQYDAVTLAVLNQADTITSQERAEVLPDLSRLLAADGLNVDVRVTSTVTGEGIADLRTQLEDIATQRRAALQRLEADVRSAGAALISAVRADGGTAARKSDTSDFAEVALALAKAAGSGVVSEAAAASYARRAKNNTGWPLTRWVRRASADPLARLHLSVRSEDKETTVTSMTSSPALKGSAMAAARRFVQESTGPMPLGWRREVSSTALSQMESLLDRSDSYVGQTDLEQERTPAWWRLWNLLQMLGLAAAIAGGAWLIAIAVGEWMLLKVPEPPYWGPAPIPTVLLVCGLLCGFLCSIVARWLVMRGREKARRRINERIIERIEAEARAGVLSVLESDAQSYEQFWAHVNKLVRVGL